MASTSNLDTSGVLISSTDPDRLVAWYRAALEPLGAVWQEHMLLVAGGMYVGFDGRDDIAGKPAEPGRHMVNFTVRDIRAAEAHLNTLGVTWIRPLEEVDDGLFFSTVTDPDGNYLQFIQVPAEQR
jgi:predicted enzyme related to lactoylglutathione lyase